MSAIRIDPSEPHPFALFSGEPTPTPFVPGGEFQFPKPRDWPSTDEAEQC